MNQNELISRGMYTAYGLWYDHPYFPQERISEPISPAENLTRFYKKQPVVWIPNFATDVLEIDPSCNPDAIAFGFKGGYDSFGVKWVPDVSNPLLPAFVEPGFILLEDIEDWESLKWPEPDDWDWESEGKEYRKAYENDGRLRRGIIHCAFFERLIDIMGFQGAAMALITDPDSVNAFMEKLTEFNIKIAKHLIEDFGCTCIKIHDDWSAQLHPFFSPETARTLLAPHIKKMVDYCHERDVIFVFHSCGNGVKMIPVMKEMGIDGWQAQIGAVNLDEAYELCGNDIVIENEIELANETSVDEVKTLIEDLIKKYGIKYRSILSIWEMNQERAPKTRRAIYELDRIYADKLNANIAK